MSLARDGGPVEPVCATNPVGEELTELQSTLGEGPCVDALAWPAPVLVADLASERFGARWPIFTPVAVRLGVRALFALPVLAGAIQGGVLEVFRDWPGLLSPDELADSLVYADAALLLMLGTREGIATEWPELAASGFDVRRAEVHQAAGMVSIQLGIGVEEALVRLRAHAYVTDRRLVEVAWDVVRRHLRFSTEGVVLSDDDHPEKEAGS